MSLSLRLSILVFMSFVADIITGSWAAQVVMTDQNKPIIAHCQDLCLKADPNMSCIEKCNGETK